MYHPDTSAVQRTKDLAQHCYIHNKKCNSYYAPKLLHKNPIYIYIKGYILHMNKDKQQKCLESFIHWLILDH